MLRDWSKYITHCRWCSLFSSVKCFYFSPFFKFKEVIFVFIIRGKKCSLCFLCARNYMTSFFLFSTWLHFKLQIPFVRNVKIREIKDVNNAYVTMRSGIFELKTELRSHDEVTFWVSNSGILIKIKFLSYPFSVWAFFSSFKNLIPELLRWNIMKKLSIITPINYTFLKR